MALAAAIAVKPIGGRGPTLLMAIGAAIFAVAHPFPTGPIGITLFGLGVAWLEVRRQAAKAPEAQAVLAP
jgi:F0F1-type ATP synthase assembly protein I